MSRKYSIVCALLSSAAACFPVAAWAQSEGGANDMLQEIIVTAQKREQSLDTVGMTINAVSGDELKGLGVNSLADLTKIEPSFVVTRNGIGQPVYSIRGISFNADTLGAPPAVSIYVDEVPFPFAALAKGATFDLERVEILKGPQGTLFGQNATGGAVNYIAAKPTDTLQLGAEARYARFNTVDLDAFVSGPITDTLRARLAVRMEQGGAWQRSVSRGNELGNRDNLYGRLLLDWTLTDNLKVSLNVNGWKNNSDNQAPALRAVALQRPPFAAAVPLTVNAAIPRHNPRLADWPDEVAPDNNEDFYQGSLRVDYDASDALKLTYVGTYQNYRQNDVLTYTGTASPYYGFQYAKIRSTSHELRASGQLLGDKINWLIGGMYSKDKDNEAFLFRVIGVTTAYSLTALPGVTGPLIGVRPTMTQDIETKAIFGNVEFHILDNLSLNGGVRYTKATNDHTGCQIAPDAAAAQTFTVFQSIRKGGVGVIPINIGDCTTLDPVTSDPTLVVDSLNEDNVSWRFGLNWTPIERTLLYATVSRGYKAGSFPNIGAVSTRALAAATQESVTAYEAGFKSRLASEKLQASGAVFYYDYKDKQQQLRIPDPAFGLLNVLLNVPKSKELGAEFSMTYLPVKGVRLDGSVTYLDSKVVGDFFNFSQFAASAAAATNFKDDPLPNTPKWAFSLGAKLDWDVNSSVGGYFAGDVRYSGATQSFFGAYTALAAGFPSMINEEYAILNIRSGVEADDGKWRVEAFGENVTNIYYTTQCTRVDTVACYTGMPATYGIRVGYKY